MLENRIYYNPINGEKTTIIKSATETNGQYSLLEVTLNPQGKNPLHFHNNFSEEFEAIHGDLYLQAGNKRVILKEGEKLMVLPKVNHKFYNPGNDTISFRVKITPGQPGFENFIRATFGLVNAGKTTGTQIPFNIFYAAVLLNWGDTHLSHFLFRLGEPILYILYKIAVLTGYEAQLFHKYCQN